MKFLSEDRLGKKLQDGNLYAAQSKNFDVVRSCSSGGIAYEIAKYGINNDYKVVGVIYDYDANATKTIVVDNIQDIELLRGSKYLQSNTVNAFKEILEDCLSNPQAKYIMFGTPCQLLGLSKLIESKKIHNEIIKIEIFCHGVPSYLGWNAYLKRKYLAYGKEKIKVINFRSKKIGWHDYVMEISTDKKTYYYPRERDLFYKAFFDTVLINKACHTCPVRKKYSASDVRLGDFWGKRYSKRQDGVSAVLVLSDKGKDLVLKLLSDTIENFDEGISTSECLQAQSVKNHKFESIHQVAIEHLKITSDLKSTIKYYRKKLPFKWRFITILKELTAYIPSKFRSNLKIFVHSIKK